MPVLGEVALEMGEIPLQQKRDPAGIVGDRMSGRFEQLGDDLRVGFSIEPDPGGGREVHAILPHGRVTRDEGQGAVPDAAQERLADQKESPVVRLAANKLLPQKQF